MVKVHVLPEAACLNVDPLRFPVVLPNKGCWQSSSVSYCQRPSSLGKDKRSISFWGEKVKIWGKVSLQFIIFHFPLFFTHENSVPSYYMAEKRFLNQVEFYPDSFLNCQESWDDKPCYGSGAVVVLAASGSQRSWVFEKQKYPHTQRCASDITLLFFLLLLKNKS